MSLGAAVGGFAQGLAGGLKLKSDLEDAEERRGLVKLQKEAAQIQINRDREEEAYRREKKETLENLLNPKQQAPEVPQIGDDGLGVPPQPGIKGPGQTGMFEGNNASISDLGTLNKLNNAMTALDAKYGKIGVKELLEGVQRYKALQQEGVMDAWQRVAAGDTEGAIQAFNSTGKFKLPEGTRFEARQEDDGFGAGRKITNYYAISPDGRTVNYRDMMRNALPPEKLMELDSATGYRIADLATKRQAEQNLASYRSRMATVSEGQLAELTRHHQETERTQLLQRQAYAEQIKDLKAAQALREQLAAVDRARSTIFSNLGVNPNLPPDKLEMLSPTEKSSYKNGLLMGEAAHTIWRMNLSPQNKEGISTSDATQIAKNASKIKIEDIKKDDGGSYVEYGKKKVYIPSLFSEPAPAPGVAPAPVVGMRPPAAPALAAPPVVTPAAGLQVRPQDLPANPRDRRAAIIQQAREADARNSAAFASEVSSLLPNLTPAQATQIQLDGRFSSLPLDVRSQVYKIANQR